MGKNKKEKIKKELTSDERFQKNLKTIRTMFIIGYFFVIFFSLHMGHSAVGGDIKTQTFGAITSGTGGVIFEDLYNASQTMLTDPFNVTPFGSFHFLYLFALSIVYWFIFAIIYLDKIRFKVDREGEENGSAKFNTDYAGFAAKYTTEVKADNNSKKKNKEDETEFLPKVDMNLMFTQKNKLSFDNRKTKRNSNTIILGGSGTGKSYSFIKPNIAQSNSSFVITDPSGEIYEDMYKFLIDEGYTVKVLNLKYYNRGNHYNPFDYLRRKEDGTVDPSSVMAMVNTFLNNVEGKSGKGDEFWRKSAEALMCCASFYLIEMMDYSQWTFANLSKIIRSAKPDESSQSSKTVFDGLMLEAKAKNPQSMAYSFYQTYKLAGEKTASSILVSTDVNLQKFSIPEVMELTSTDLDNIENNINLNTIGENKTALFIITQTGGGPVDFLCSMLYSQLFDILYDRGETYYPLKQNVYSKNNYPIETMFDSVEEAQKYIDDINSSVIVERKENTTVTYLYELPNGKIMHKRQVRMNPDIDKFYKHKLLSFDTREKAEAYKKEFEAAKIIKGELRSPWAVTCLLDEFNNIQEIPNFDNILATCRKYNINISIVLQNLAQLKARYKDAWNTILGNCDNFLFLGSNESETCKYVSDILGDGTIITKSTNRTFEKKGSSSNGFSTKARKLLDPSELVRLDNRECIYVMRGEFPFKVPKIEFDKHPNYYRTGCGDESLKTNEQEMKAIYCGAKKKIRRKRNTVKRNMITEQVKEQTPVKIETAEDVMNAVDTYSPKETAKVISEPKRKTTGDVRVALMEKAKAKVQVDEQGTETWMF